MLKTRVVNCIFKSGACDKSSTDALVAVLDGMFAGDAAHLANVRHSKPSTRS